MKRQDQTKPYDAKTACWVPDEKECFVQATITGTKGDQVTVKLPSGDVSFVELFIFIFVSIEIGIFGHIFFRNSHGNSQILLHLNYYGFGKKIVAMELINLFFIHISMELFNMFKTNYQNLHGNQF